MNDQFQRILDLVRRTGDRMVVTDPNGEDAYVVMGLEAYEALLDAEDDYGDVLDELPDEFFADAPVEHFGPTAAPDAPEAPAAAQPEPPMDIWEAMKPADEAGDTWDLDAMSEHDRLELERQFAKWQEAAADEAPQAPQDREKPAESDSEGSDEDDYGEEQFYLEPIE